ncbi:MAG: hypothetical protein JWO05_3828 [Gemmatimonadetes bacterium]|nr:hypothetical protein [Gemmatimonadota bacterium]
MRHAALAIALLIPVVLSAQDSTSAAKKSEQPQRTLAALAGIKHCNASFGGSSVPYLGRSQGGQAADFRLGFTPGSLPNWTIAFATSAVLVGDTTSYIAPGSVDYHPQLTSVTAGVEVQRRWRRGSIFVPVASLGAGTLGNSYSYYEYPKSGGAIAHNDEEHRTSYQQLAGGVEVVLQAYLRASFLVGYRQAGDTPMPGFAGKNGGATTTVLVSLGKF